jgi:cytochrome c biogenesis protein CcmG/thiol:disulfide interchange protein DsbE
MQNITSFRRRYWIFSALVLTVSLGWIWMSTAYFHPAGNADQSAPFEGFRAPDFQLKTSAGDVYQLSSLRGKVVLLNFWASWCPACRAEMPAIQQTLVTFKTQDLLILAINDSLSDDPLTAGQFIIANQLDFPVLFDSDGAVSRKYQVRALPTSYFIDRRGIIRQVTYGQMPEAFITAQVTELLAEDE